MSSINDLSVQQLRQAAALKEKIEALQNELSQLLGSTAKAISATPAKAPKKKGGMSAAGRASVAAAMKARWAKINAAKASVKSVATAKPAVKTVVAAKPAVKAVATAKPAKKKSGMDAAAKAKLSIAMKAAWAARKAAKK